jgi:hypothetical protein
VDSASYAALYKGFYGGKDVYTVARGVAVCALFKPFT